MKLGLDNHLQVPGIADHVLNGLFLGANAHAALVHGSDLVNLGEEYPTVLDAPAVFPGKVDDGAFRVEEEKVLG